MMAIVSFGLSILSIILALQSRAKSEGRLAQAIDSATASDRDVSKMLQGQASSIQQFAEALKAQAEAMHAVATSFKEFAGTQKETNNELWTAIQVQSGRVNSISTDCTVRCRFPGLVERAPGE